MRFHRRLALISGLSALCLVFPTIVTRPQLVYAAASSDARPWTADESERAAFQEAVLRWEHTADRVPDMSAEDWQLADSTPHCSACCSERELAPSAKQTRGQP